MAGGASRNNTIDYIEFGMTDISEAKRFYAEAFGWEFTDYDLSYVGIKGADGREMGGFTRTDAVTRGGVLPVLYSDDLEQSLTAVRKAGGVVIRDIFPFTGGRRFHFSDPSGNEVAVWSDS